SSPARPPSRGTRPPTRTARPRPARRRGGRVSGRSGRSVWRPRGPRRPDLWPSASNLADGGQVEVEDRLFLLALDLVLLAKAHDLADHLGVVALALGLGEDLLDVVGDRGLVLLEALDALDDRLQP